MKLLGSEEDTWTQGGALCPAGDGNLFLATYWLPPQGGFGLSKPFLMKVEPSGEVIWSRVFYHETLYGPIGMQPTTMFVDSEKRLVMLGRALHRIGGFWEEKDFICRYAPEQDSILWIKYLASQQSSSHELRAVQKPADGNYLLFRTLNIGTDGEEAEILEINRQNGSTLTNGARKLGLNENTQLGSVLAHKGGLYLAGTQGRKGAGGGDHLLCKLNSEGTQVIWANVGPGIPEAVRHVGLLIDQDTLVTLYVGRDTTAQKRLRFLYMQKTTLDGSTVWVRRYEFPNLHSIAAHSISLLESGYLISGAERAADSGDHFIFSTDKWGRAQKTASVQTPPPFEREWSAGHNALVVSESIYITGTFLRSSGPPLFRDIYRGMLLKTDVALTDIQDCPFRPMPSPVLETVLSHLENTPISLIFSPSSTKALNMSAFASADSIAGRTDCVVCAGPCGPPLWLGPDQEFFADTSVLLNAGAGHKSYLWQDGSTAPHYLAKPGGTYWVEVKDACGFVQRDSIQLRFTETVCDQKEISCIRWELLDVRSVEQSNLRFRFRLTNFCTSGLEHVSFQVPSGLVAVQPSAQSLYTASSGRAYAVRNPNYSPFYSVRLKAAGGTALSDGAADVFEYRLPAQTAPAYIGTAVRLNDGSTFNTVLNTFDCPPASTQERTLEAQPNHKPHAIWPNPSTGTLWFDWFSKEAQPIYIQIVSPQGQVLQTTHLKAGQDALVLDADLADGLYLAIVQPENEVPVTLRFVLKK
jgi:hypothetical protein